MKSGCVLCGSTGSGKSLTGLAYYKQSYANLPLYIITTSKKRDDKEWEDELAKLDIFSCVSIDSWNNIKKYTDISGAFFMFDEQKASGHGKWARNLITLAKKNKWVLLSATPGDNWEHWATLFIANGFIKNRTTFKEDFCIYSPYTKFPKITGYRREEILEKMRKTILVMMEYKSDKIPIPDVIPYEVDTDEETYVLACRKSLRHPEMRPFRNLSQMLAYIRIRIPVPNSRVAPLVKIIQDKRRVIVFYNFVDEKFEIEKAAKEAGVEFKQRNGQIHDDCPTGDAWVYAVQYYSGAEAWNCITCDTMVFYSLNYSYILMTQAKGRIDRVNSPYDTLYYYYFIAPMFDIDQSILKSLSKKEKFNEKAFADARYVADSVYENQDFIQPIQKECKRKGR